MIPIYAIIVAGGSGSRMQSAIPKQFLPLLGEPILVHTLHAFLAIPDIQIRLVLPANEISFWEKLLDQLEKSRQNQFNNQIQVVAGGATRFQSVSRGLESIPPEIEEAIVLVHDAVRPLIEVDKIHDVMQAALDTGAAALAVALKDTPREVLADGQNKSLDRSKIQLMQTPQGFRLGTMRLAFQLGEQPHFTDCASVLESAGHPIKLVAGSYQNLKITTPEDLLLAEALLKQRVR